MKTVFISDCEGPISKNDNAFEITSSYIPNGDKLFTVISRYDDFLADVLKKPGYKAGYTLKLISPFLKAYHVTDRKMQRFSAQSLVLISDIRNTLEYVKSIAHAFIVSTSYEHYIKALCQTLNFPYENTYCTKMRIDKYDITEEERDRLKRFAREISRMSIIEMRPNVKSLEDFPEEYRKTIQRLDEIFWKEMASMTSGRFLHEVDLVGSEEKADAVRDAAERISIDLSRVMYVGDSITDVDAFKLLKRKGGLAVSFNGNQYAIRNAEIAVLSESSIVMAIISDVFCRFGKQETICLVENWSREALKKSPVRQALLNRLFGLYSGRLPKVEMITSENMENLTRESNEFRKKVRGEAIGRLG
jgi:energy-converting hydrogenase A subunit R